MYGLEHLITEVAGLDQDHFIRIANGIQNLGLSFKKCIELEELVRNYEKVSRCYKNNLHLCNPGYFTDISWSSFDELSEIKKSLDVFLENIKKEPLYFESLKIDKIYLGELYHFIFCYEKELPFYIEKAEKKEALERQERDKKNNSGFVYLIQDLNFKTYKIGCSKNPKSRLNALQLATSNKLNLVYYKKCFSPYIVEQEMHEIFKSKRLASEWFKLTTEDAEKFKNILESLCQK